MYYYYIIIIIIIIILIVYFIYISNNLNKEHFKYNYLSTQHLRPDYLRGDHLEDDHLRDDYLSHDHLRYDKLNHDYLSHDKLSHDVLVGDYLHDDKLHDDYLIDDHVDNGNLDDLNRKKEDQLIKYFYDQYVAKQYIPQKHNYNTPLHREVLTNGHFQGELFNDYKYLSYKPRPYTFLGYQDMPMCVKNISKYKQILPEDEKRTEKCIAWLNNSKQLNGDYDCKKTFGDNYDYVGKDQGNCPAGWSVNICKKRDNAKYKLWEKCIYDDWPGWEEDTRYYVDDLCQKEFGDQARFIERQKAGCGTNYSRGLCAVNPVPVL